MIPLLVLILFIDGFSLATAGKYTGRCGTIKYFDHKQCPDKSVYTCKEPTLSLYGKRFTCDTWSQNTAILEIQLGSTKDWTQLRKNEAVHCQEEKRIKFVTDRSESIQWMRCIANKKCDEETVRESCAVGCDDIVIEEYSIKCEKGLNLEGQTTTSVELPISTWMYMNKVNCHGTLIFPDDDTWKFEKYRCRKGKCNAENLHFTSECDKNKICRKVTFKAGINDEKLPHGHYECDEGLQLEYAASAKNKQWERASNLTCERSPNETFPIGQIKTYIDGHKTRIIPERVRCMKERGCDIENFFDKSECKGKIECQKPSSIINNSDVILECNDDFGLQAEFDQAWTDVSFAKCKSDKQFESVKRDDGETTSDYPTGFRCVRMKIDKFIGECNADEECDDPRNCTSLSCYPMFSLQLKDDLANPWNQVNATCNSDQFVANGIRVEEPSPSLRCVQMKCTQCENPCVGCVSNGAMFKPSAEWNQCAEFKCGANARMILKMVNNETKILQDVKFVCGVEEANGKAAWVMNGIKVESVDCEYDCIKHSPLKTSCDPDDTHCDRISFENPERCDGKTYYTSENQSRVEITNLHCNKVNGSWLAYRGDNNRLEVVKTGTNVHCHLVCDNHQFFPSCDSEEGCADLIEEGNKFRCNEPTVFWSRQSHDGVWEKMTDVLELECLAGKIFAKGTKKEYNFQMDCRPESEEAARKAGSQVPLYMGLFFLVLVFIVIIVAIIVLRASGRGWLHKIVIDAMRDKKKKKRRPTPSATPSPSPTVYSHSPFTSPSKETVTEEQKVDTKEVTFTRSAESTPSLATSEEFKSKTKSDTNVIVV